MTIKRNIQGLNLAIDLTDEELYNAYREQQHIFDLQDVKNYFDAFDDDEIMDMYGVTRRKLSEIFEDVADEMRRNIDHYDMSFTFARDAAISEVFDQRGFIGE